MGIGYSTWRFCVSLVSLCALAIVNTGCKAGPAKSAGFVDASLMGHDKTLPFQKYWQKPGLDKAKYTKIYIAPVNTAYMLKMTDWQKGDRKEQFTADVAMIAKYTETAMKKAYTDDPKHRYTVVDSPTKDPDTLIFEMALIEIVPSKVVLNALGYTPFFIGMGITAVRGIAQDESTVAFEARILDASTGETVIMLADREAEQKAIATVRGLTWYSHAQFIISQWASQFVQMANQKPGEVIKETDPFTLQPF